MPNLGNPALTTIEAIGLAFIPYIFLAVATFAAGMWAWAQMKKGSFTWQQFKQEAADEAVAATEQAVGQANKDGKFDFAKALLESKVGKLGYTEAVSLIESAVLRLKAQFVIPAAQSETQAIAAATTSESAKPILKQIGAPTTAQRIGADEAAILRAVREETEKANGYVAWRLGQLESGVSEAKARAIAAEQAARTPQTTAPKKAAATVLPATDAASSTPAQS